MSNTKKVTISLTPEQQGRDCNAQLTNNEFFTTSNKSQ